jgi:hypothetical protein
MILQIGARVNRASKKVRYEPEAPATGLNRHARTDHSSTSAAERVDVRSFSARRSEDVKSPDLRQIGSSMLTPKVERKARDRKARRPRLAQLPSR